MNIYKVTRISECGYDQYSSFVCFARSSEEAKNLDPSFVEIDHPKFNEYLNDPDYHLSFYMIWKSPEERSLFNDWVENKDDLIVTKLGISDSNQVGIILTSYHAG